MRTCVAIAALMVAASVASAQDAKEIERKIAAVKVSTDFKDTSLDEVVEFLRELAGINIMVDPAVKEKNIQITLKVKDVSVKTVLNLIMEMNAIGWKYREEVLYITTSDKLKEDVVLKIYDVQDLLAPIKQFPGAEIGLSDTGVDVIPTVPDDTGGDTLESVLEDLIKTHTGIKAWDDNPNASIQLNKGLLIIKQTKEVHKEVGRFLARLRQFK